MIAPLRANASSVRKRRRRRREELHEGRRLKVARRKATIVNAEIVAEDDMTIKSLNMPIMANPAMIIARTQTAQKAMLVTQLQLHLSTPRRQQQHYHQSPNNPETSTRHPTLMPHGASPTDPRHKPVTCWTTKSRPRTPTESLVTCLVQAGMEIVSVPLAETETETDDLAMATSRARALIEWNASGSGSGAEIESMKAIIGGREMLLVDGRRGGVLGLAVVGPVGGLGNLDLVAGDLVCSTTTSLSSVCLHNSFDKVKSGLGDGLLGGMEWICWFHLDRGWIGYVFGFLLPFWLRYPFSFCWRLNVYSFE